jgi:hypothetical protein
LNDLVWTKHRIGAFLERACLSDDERDVFVCWADKKYSPDRTATMLSMSKPKVERLRRKIRLQYDVIQQEYPDIFPPRVIK